MIINNAFLHSAYLHTHPYIFIFYVYSANAGPVTLVEIVEKKLTNV